MWPTVVRWRAPPESRIAFWKTSAMIEPGRQGGGRRGHSAVPFPDPVGVTFCEIKRGLGEAS
jgi:hypothetical protein